MPDEPNVLPLLPPHLPASLPQDHSKHQLTLAAKSNAAAEARHELSGHFQPFLFI